jgi:hypothetical protein
VLTVSFWGLTAPAAEPASRHDDLSVIHVGSGGVRSDGYDSEAHGIRYVVQSPAPGQAVFLSELATDVPRFRLTYTSAAEEGLDVKFEIAPPASTRGRSPSG